MAPRDKTLFIGNIEAISLGASTLIDDPSKGAYLIVVCPANSEVDFMQEVREMANYYSIKVVSTEDVMKYSARFPNGSPDPLFSQKAKESEETETLRIIQMHMFPLTD